ncbi:hypothetical protein KQI84_03560 [bacterium]|nr:hypothetical protein [bacterium]
MNLYQMRRDPYFRRLRALSISRRWGALVFLLVAPKATRMLAAILAGNDGNFVGFSLFIQTLILVWLLCVGMLLLILANPDAWALRRILAAIDRKTVRDILIDCKPERLNADSIVLDLRGIEMEAERFQLNTWREKAGTLWFRIAAGIHKNQETMDSAFVEAMTKEKLWRHFPHIVPLRVYSCEVLVNKRILTVPEALSLMDPRRVSYNTDRNSCAVWTRRGPRWLRNARIEYEPGEEWRAKTTTDALSSAPVENIGTALP